jgi:hypothetical protein
MCFQLMSEPLVSVLVNNYNYGGFLAAAINSARDQIAASRIRPRRTTMGLMLERTGFSQTARDGGSAPAAWLDCSVQFGLLILAMAIPTT